MAREVFTSTTTWQIPAGVTSVMVECWGGGGSGAKSSGSCTGGGGGGYSKAFAVTVTPGNTYDVVVGQGGAGVASTGNGNAGGDSYFIDSSTVLAKGGAGGNNSSSAASGGAAGSGIGDIKFSGGNSGSASNGISGGGGGAGDSSNGSNGTNAGSGQGTAGGAGGSFEGGAGSEGDSSPTAAGGIYGGGGGGLGQGGGGTSNAGGRGEVRISYGVYIKTRSTGRTSTTNTTSHSISMPSDIDAGNLLIIIFSSDGSPTCSIASGGWTMLGQESNSTIVTGAVFYKVAAGGDTATVDTSATEQSSHIVLNIKGTDATLEGTAANGSSTNSNPPSHTPSGGSKDYLYVATRSGDSTVLATANPTGYLPRIFIAAAGTGGASTNTSEKHTTASSSDDPATFTSASEQWASWTLSVTPQSVVASPSQSLTTMGVG